MSAELAVRLEALMARYGIAELEIDEGNLQLRLGRRPAAAAPDATSVTVDDPAVLRATTFGTLRLSHPASTAGALPLPRRVRRGAIIAYAAVGPLLRPILAERDATLLRPLQADGAAIGYGDPVFAVEQGQALQGKP